MYDVGYYMVFWTLQYLDSKEVQTYLKWKKIDKTSPWLTPKQVIGTINDSVTEVVNESTFKCSLKTSPSQQNYAPDLFAGEKLTFTSGGQKDQEYMIKTNSKYEIILYTPNAAGYDLKGIDTEEKDADGNPIKKDPVQVGDSFTLTPTSVWYVVDVIRKYKHQPSGIVGNVSGNSIMPQSFDYPELVPPDHDIDGWTLKVKEKTYHIISFTSSEIVLCLRYSSIISSFKTW